MKKKDYKKAYDICPLVEAACVISSNNAQRIDIDETFNSWVANYIKERLKKK